jgi:hypothetical protein
MSSKKSSTRSSSKSSSRSSNKKKLKGIYIVSRRHNSKKMVADIIKKKWDDILGIDISLLYENKWTTSDICKKFDITPLTVIHRIRYH